MIISDKYEIVFVAIPKTGTRSIYRVLLNSFNGQKLRDHQKTIPEKYKDYYSFTVIRNPYDRLVSVWWSTCKRGLDKKGYISKYLKKDASFLNFCKNLKNLNSIKHVPHPNRQLDWIENNKFNKTIRFENLDNEWLTLPFNKKTKTQLGHLNPTNRKSINNPVAREPYEKYLCKETIEIINDYYAEDFEKLNYKKL